MGNVGRVTTELPSSVDVAVVGGGLAGLAAARAVQSAGRSVVVLEASDGVGGRVRSDSVDGFIVDRGFQVLLTAYPEAQQQLDLDALALRAFDPGSMVWAAGRPWAMGDPLRRPGLAVASALAPFGSLTDKARLGRLLWRMRSADPRLLLRSPDLSTTDWLADLGFSSRAVDRFFRPLLGGIQLDAELAGSARMAAAVLHCLAVGDSAVPAAGMQAIPNQLASHLAQGVVHLNTPVASVASGSVRVADGREVRAKAVVVATEAPAAAQLLTGRVADRGSRPAVAVWFRASRAPVQQRLIVLDGERSGPALNVAVMSNVAPEYVPSSAAPGTATVVAACPSVDAATPEASIVEMVRQQLVRWWGGEVASWDVLAVHRIAHAQPSAVPPFGPKRSQSLGDGLWVCGDHRDTPSIQGALFSGRRCAEALLAS